MSYIKELGLKAFGSRMKNLSDSLMQDVLKIYKEIHVDFEPRWFTIFQLLLAKQAVPITEIANELEQSHPSVIQVVNVLEKKKLIISTKDENDQRKRLITLSKKGFELAHKLQDTWDDVFDSTSEILRESDPDFLEHIAQFERAYNHSSLYNRIRDRIKARMIHEISYIPYEQSFQQSFQSLNEDWLIKYLSISEHDRKMLNDPEKEIIHKSGFIYLALYQDEIIGSLAIQKVSPTACELSKFTVKEEFRGWGIGKSMLEFALKISKKEQYSTMLLYTHPKLNSATALYKQSGFKEINTFPGLSDPTGRCSVLMKKNINP